MKTYDAICRPGGQLTHEVPKYGLTAAEVYLLRSIHGDDGVIKLRPSKSKPFAVPGSIDERDRLKAIYGDRAFAQVFGSTFGAQLPQEVPAAWLEGAVEAESEAEADTPVAAAA